MKTFILGRTGSGKTPLAKMLAARLGMIHIGGSEWIRKRFKDLGGLDRVAFTQAITAFTATELLKEPRACVDFIRSTYDLSRDCVIEGLRNPADLAALFDPRTDVAVFIERYDNTLPATEYERDGIMIAFEYVRFLVRHGLMRRAPERLIEVDLIQARSPEDPNAPAHFRDGNGRVVCSCISTASDYVANLLIAIRAEAESKPSP